MNVRRFYALIMSAAAVAVLLLGIACASKTDLHKTLKASSIQSLRGGPVLLAAYQPWFGRGGHINVGYSTQDRVVIDRQITEAKNLGIEGFVVNWYGPRKDFEDSSYSKLQQQAAQTDFKVALMYDEDDSNPGSSTEATISDLQYAYDHYIGPQSRVSNAPYLRYQGRPVIFIFPKGQRTDWNRVREVVNSWQDPPLIIYKDFYPKFANAFDGYYAWVQPGRGGWARDGSNWGRDYLQYFYTTMNAKYPDKIAVGAAWPGFNDSKASWSRNRRMDSRCGKTFEESLREFRRYYNDEHPLPFLMIVTWNDYEEGTAIERGYANCKGGNSVAHGPINTSGD